MRIERKAGMKNKNVKILAITGFSGGGGIRLVSS